MIYGYARVSTDGQSEAVPVRQHRTAGAAGVFREVVSGARPTARRVAGAQTAAGDVVMETRLDRLTRSTRDLLNTLAAITDRSSFPIPGRRMGQHDHHAWQFDGDSARRAGRVRS
jgi:DNA invertase Pin-like site-specific DNA recombinase